MSSIADNSRAIISSSSKEQAVATPSVNSSRKHASCENSSNKESKSSGKEDQHGLDGLLRYPLKRFNW
jgi:hypothetical protein